MPVHGLSSDPRQRGIGSPYGDDRRGTAANGERVSQRGTDPRGLPGDPGHYPLTQTGRVPPRLTIFIVNWELTRARPGSSASSFM